MSESVDQDNADRLEAGDGSASRPVARWRTLRGREYAIAIAIVLALSALLTSLKLIDTSSRMGDTAVYLQFAENIANRGLPVSSVETNTLAYVKSGLLIMSPEDWAKQPLTPPSGEYNELKGHEYLIMYPIGLLVKFFPTDAVVMAVDVLSFTGLALIAYFELRARRVSIAAAALFCLLIATVPAWSESLLLGQFYPDRIFLAAGLGFMCLVSRPNVKRAYLVAAAIACAIIHERAAITAGLFLLLYVGFYWKEDRENRRFRLGLGLSLLAYGWFVVNFVVDKVYYAGFLPHGLDGLLAVMRAPDFGPHVTMFLLVNSVLLLIGLFQPRAAAIAAILMVPNIVGNIGGAEKVGWTTHYHTYYLPSLIWAALLGYSAAYKRVTSVKRRAVFYAASIAAIVFLGSIDPYSAGHPSVQLANLSNHFLVKLQREQSLWTSPSGYQARDLKDSVARAIPENTVVSSSEQWMSALYKRRVLHFFPIGIDTADYATVSVVPKPGGGVAYGGVVSYLPPDQRAKVDELIVARMRKDGYDFAHAFVVPAFGVAVVKRVH